MSNIDGEMASRPQSTELSGVVPKRTQLNGGIEVASRTKTVGQVDYPRQKDDRGKKPFKRPPLSSGGQWRRDFQIDSRRSEQRNYMRTDEVVEELLSSDCPDVSSLAGRKVNLTHLLNFRVAPVVHKSCYDTPRCRPRQQLSIHPVYNKQQYLHANCQFVVSTVDTVDLSSVQDADQLVDWDKIQQVRLYGESLPSCPICLESPCAPRITKCGHVFCYHCLLNVFAHEELDAAKCPICFDIMSSRESHSVVSSAIQTYSVGDSLRMVLMKRLKSGLRPIPVGGLHSSSSEEYCGISEGRGSQFCKILTATPSEIQAVVITPEKEALLSLLEEETDALVIPVIKEALKMIAERESVNKLFIGNTPTQELVHPSQSSPEHGHGATSAGEVLGKEEKDDCDYCYFYQADDGQAIYLSAVNANCLAYEYGSLAKCPHEIVGRIIEIEQFSMGQMKSEMPRFLSHLPKMCNFSFIELALKNPQLSKQTYKEFAEEFRQRKEKRDHKKRVERKRERKIAAAREHRTPDMKFALEDDAHFPVFGRNCEQVEDTPLPSLGGSSEDNSLAGDNATGQPAIEEEESLALSNSCYPGIMSPTVPGCSKFTSFAHVLMPPTTGATNSGDTVTFASVMSSGNKSGSVTPRSWVKTPASTSSTTNSAADLDEDIDSLPAPSYRDAFSFALSQSVEGAMSDMTLTPSSGGIKQGKKKKRGKVVIFSTGSNFNL